MAANPRRTNSSWSGQREAFPRNVRVVILRRDPVCVLCRTNPATIADHQPSYMALVRAGVANPHDEQYGQGVCVPCHDIKTKAEARAGRMRMSPKRQGRTHPSDGPMPLPPPSTR